MEEPLISVIVPFYNASKTIERAIHSALIQSYSNIEVIVIDDGSAQSETEILKKIIYQLNDSRVIVDFMEINRGTSSARNRGMDLSRGEYIAFLDADDSWIDTKIEQQMEFHFSNPNLYISAHNMGILSSENPIFKFKKKFFVIDWWYLLIRNVYLTPSVILKKNDLRFDESFRRCDDIIFWCTYIKNVRKIGGMAIFINLTLGNVHKPLFGHSGLTGNVTQMIIAEFLSTRQLYKNDVLNLFNYILFSLYLIIKVPRKIYKATLVKTKNSNF